MKHSITKCELFSEVSGLKQYPEEDCGRQKVKVSLLAIYFLSYYSKNFTIVKILLKYSIHLQYSCKITYSNHLKRC